MAAGFDAGDNNKTFLKTRTVSNDHGLSEPLALYGILDSLNKLTYSFSHFDPTPTSVSSVQKIKQGSEAG